LNSQRRSFDASFPELDKHPFRRMTAGLRAEKADFVPYTPLSFISSIFSFNSMLTDRPGLLDGGVGWGQNSGAIDSLRLENPLQSS
jgi:hypothetical protein